MGADEWVLSAKASSTTENLGSQNRLPRAIEDILRSRGILSDLDREQFLYPKLSQLKDPACLLGMGEAVERMTAAFLRKEKICIYADFDLDGTSGLALLLKGLKALGFEHLIGYQPRRLKSGYGFHQEVVTELANQGVKLIVTVDVGITALSAAERAQELGVDVIITDHHQPGETLPRALVVVNPNQKNCTSGLGYLSGAGVAFYLLRALRRGLDPLLTPEARAWDIKSVLDFFTIATITDMVPLIEDNRVLIKHGLHRLAKTEHVGLQVLLDELEMAGRPLGSQDVGIRFSPKLNALSRMDSEILPIDIMMAEEELEAQRLVKQVMLTNQNRITQQAEAEREAQEILEEKGGPQGYIFLASKNFHRGVIGLIANRLSQLHQVPAFIGSIDIENQKVVGSARSPEGSISLLDILGEVAEGLERFGGHHAAAGFEFKLGNLQEVEENFEKTFEAIRDPKLGFLRSVRPITYDSEIEIQELNSHFMNWYDFLGPFGAGFDLPVFCLKGVSVETLRILKGSHLKLKLVQSSMLQTHSLETLFFSPNPQQMEELKPGLVLDILFEPQWNYFAGRKTIQAILRKYRISGNTKKNPDLGMASL